MIAGSVAGSIAVGGRVSASDETGAETPRAGAPAATIPAPTTTTAMAASPNPAAPRAGPEIPRGTSRPANARTRSASDFGAGTSRSISGRAAHISTSPVSNPTLVPNSSVCGAIRSVLVIATSSPNTTRPTRPDGDVLGSVIMKNRKIRSSGEVTMTRQ